MTALVLFVVAAALVAVQGAMEVSLPFTRRAVLRPDAWEGK